ncbi:tRNA (guanosine(37)-N1)-methyltransferase TrmD [Alphaproteobacteria bacterium]|nr:tRNA (guanosine(37)-N1)-methyltransferase TrmD [Alphaproteobacteria bacterium]
MTWHATLFTLFPEMFPGPLAHSISGKMLGKHWSFEAINIRDFATDKHQTVDDTCFGGGAGMVMRPDVLDAALRSVPDLEESPLIYLSPRGRPLTQDMVKKFISFPRISLICGRYEGIDERIIQSRDVQEVSIGDFVLSGGEIAALVFMDACIRLLPGVMGNDQSHEEESFEDGLLEYPHYTRPREWKGLEVPDVLFSGHHEKIKKWRQDQSEKLTKERRPDLWKKYTEKKS